MQGIDINLGVEIQGGGGLGLPPLQVTNYRPANGQTVPLCFSAEAADLMSPDAFEFFQLIPETITYEGESVDMMVIAAPVRWVVLGQPRLMLLNKASKDITPLTRGKMPSGHVTATRLFLLAMVGDKLLMNTDGEPQIFTLKLTSNKTRIVSGTKGDRSGSIAGLNDSLLKHYKLTRRSLVHLCSLEITAAGQKFTSSSTGESSVGVMFSLSNAKALPAALQSKTAAVASSEFIQGLLLDPFGVNQDKPQSLDAPIADEYDGVF